jgi:hypothetical protein
MAQDSSGATGIHLTDTSGAAALDHTEELRVADRAGAARTELNGWELMMLPPTARP